LSNEIQKGVKKEMKRTLIIGVAVAVIIALLLGAFGCQGPEGLQGPQGERGKAGKDGDDGRDGKDGVDITGANVDSSGRLILTLSNGKTINAGYVKGDKGDTGASGGGGGSYSYPVKGDKGEPGISGAFVFLIQKDSSTWQSVADGAVGILFYAPIGSTFDFYFGAKGLELDTDYSLIYYADFDDRFSQWGGNNPGALIAVGTSSDTGGLTLEGSVELNMSLPCPPDANIATYNYSGAPDYYAHAYGAKIWLVPSDCYDAEATQVTAWAPSRFLFETDLITYIDTD
jgi:hypothetical protein